MHNITSRWQIETIIANSGLRASPQVSPTMCAEELTNQVLYMRNIPAGEKDVWMTFEAIEEGELGKNKMHTTILLCSILKLGEKQ